MKLNWQVWVYGLFAALIGGGAAALVTGIASATVDPAHADVTHLLKLTEASFVIGAIIAVAGFLKQSPLPPPIDVQVKQTTTTPVAGGTQTTEVKMTGQVPNDKA